MKPKFLWKLCFLSAFAMPAQAADFDVDAYVDQVQQDSATTWNSDEYDAYVPLYAWHNRLAYDQKHIDKYNENPWGFGIGKSRFDADGNWHGLYAMAFKDSNSYAETFFGYAFLKNWFVDCNPDFRVGVGYTLGLTQRHEYKYVPLPLPLPIAGVEYKRAAIQAAYVPGIKNDGNVLFVWTRIAVN